MRHGPAREGRCSDRARDQAGGRTGRERDGRLGPHVEHMACVPLGDPERASRSRPTGAGDRGADRRLVLPHMVVALAGSCRDMRGEWRQAVEAIERSQAISRDAQDCRRFRGLVSDRPRRGLSGTGRSRAGARPTPRRCCAASQPRTGGGGNRKRRACPNPARVEGLAAREEIESALERASELLA